MTNTGDFRFDSADGELWVKNGRIFLSKDQAKQLKEKLETFIQYGYGEEYDEEQNQ